MNAPFDIRTHTQIDGRTGDSLDYRAAIERGLAERSRLAHAMLSAAARSVRALFSDPGRCS